MLLHLLLGTHCDSPPVCTDRSYQEVWDEVCGPSCTEGVEQGAADGASCAAYQAGRSHSVPHGFEELCYPASEAPYDAGLCGDYTYDVAYARAWQDAGCPDEDYAGPTDLPEGWEDPDFDTCPVESDDSG